MMSMLVFSCSLNDDDTANYHYEWIPTVSVEFPEEMHVNQVNEVTMYFNLPSTCYSVTSLDYNYTADFERTVSLIATVMDNAECEDISDSLLNESFDFVPTVAGTYTFKFLTGVDATTSSYNYLEYEVEVLE